MSLVELVQQGFQAYQSVAQAHPLLTTMATAQVTFPVGDVIAQTVENRAHVLERVPMGKLRVRAGRDTNARSTLARNTVEHTPHASRRSKRK